MAKLNPLTAAAFVSIEDRRFYRHWGLDPRGDRPRDGGQLAWRRRPAGRVDHQQRGKTSFLSNKRTVKRKAQEVIIAFWLEAWLTKEEILSRYLRLLRRWRLRTARCFPPLFQPRSGRLTLAQSAMLAGVVQAPSRLAPTKHLAAAQKWQAGAEGHGGHGCDQCVASTLDVGAADHQVIEGADGNLLRRLGR